MIRVARLFPAKYQAFIIEHGILLFVIPGALLALISYFVFFDVRPHRHESYRLYKVVNTAAFSADSVGFRLRVVFEIEDGNLRYVTLRSIAAAQQIVDTICVERRIREDGSFRYKRTKQDNCT